METFNAAVKENLPKVVEALLKTHDPSLLDNWAIRHAASRGFNEIVKILLQDKRVDPTAVDNQAIRLAAQNGYAVTVKILLDDVRVDPGANNNYAIRWASENGHLEVISVLLNHPNVSIKAGLEAARSFKQTEVVKFIENATKPDLKVLEYYRDGKILTLKIELPEYL